MFIYDFWPFCITIQIIVSTCHVNSPGISHYSNTYHFINQWFSIYLLYTMKTWKACIYKIFKILHKSRKSDAVMITHGMFDNHCACIVQCTLYKIHVHIRCYDIMECRPRYYIVYACDIVRKVFTARQNLYQFKP